VPAVKLTSLSHGAGCACKLPASELHALLGDLPAAGGGDLLVGADTADDAAVYRLSDDLALVSTADFFTPIVDDPYDFGRVAAANALSDVYAMGGTPLIALNRVAWSLEEIGGDALREVLRGGSDVASSAGVRIAGGHSIDDREPKYGLAVTGTVHPDRLVRNSTAQAGDELWLTKPVGGGAASTAMKRGTASADLSAAAVDVMTTLNREASRSALEAGATAMTDVTGFGLLGHLRELATASGLAAGVEAAAVPPCPACWTCSAARPARGRRHAAKPHLDRGGGPLGAGGARGAALASLRRHDIRGAPGVGTAGRGCPGSSHRQARGGRGGPHRGHLLGMVRCSPGQRPGSAPP
jgi:selenide,water dikinase